MGSGAERDSGAADGAAAASNGQQAGNGNGDDRLTAVSKEMANHLRHDPPEGKRDKRGVLEGGGAGMAGVGLRLGTKAPKAPRLGPLLCLLASWPAQAWTAAALCGCPDWWRR